MYRIQPLARFAGECQWRPKNPLGTGLDIHHLTTVCETLHRWVSGFGPLPGHELSGTRFLAPSKVPRIPVGLDDPSGSARFGPKLLHQSNAFRDAGVGDFIR